MPDLQAVDFHEFDIHGGWEVIRERQIERLTYAATLDVPHLTALQPHGGRAVIIGGAPSGARGLAAARAAKSREIDLVFSLNGAHEWLVKNGVPPSMHVMFEVDLERPQDSTGGDPHADTYYYVCSHCLPSVHDALAGYRRVLWHCWNDPPEYQDLVARLFPGEFMVGGGHVTLFRTLNVAIILGYRHFDLYGCDCSFEQPGQSHLPDYHNRPLEPEMDIWVGESADDSNLRQFRTLGTLAFNASEFMKFCEANQAALSLRVHGDGLLSHLHKSRYPEQYLQGKDYHACV